MLKLQWIFLLQIRHTVSLETLFVRICNLLTNTVGLIEQSDKRESKYQLISMINRLAGAHYTEVPCSLTNNIFIVEEVQFAWLQLQFSVVHPGVQSANLYTVVDSPRDLYWVWSTIAVYYNHRVLLPVIHESDF